MRGSITVTDRVADREQRDRERYPALRLGVARARIRTSGVRTAAMSAHALACIHAHQKMDCFGRIAPDSFTKHHSFTNEQCLMKLRFRFGFPDMDVRGHSCAASSTPPAVQPSCNHSQTRPQPPQRLTQATSRIAAAQALR